MTNYKAADYFEVYVRFEKGELYCTHTLAYVFFRELSFISEFLESFGEFFLKILKHFTPLLRFPPRQSGKNTIKFGAFIDVFVF